MNIGTIERTINKLEKEKGRIDATLDLLRESKTILEDVENSIMSVMKEESVMKAEVEKPKTTRTYIKSGKYKKRRVGRPKGSVGAFKGKKLSKEHKKKIGKGVKKACKKRRK